MELKVLWAGERTIGWYARKMDWYQRNGSVQTPEELNAFELKRYLADLQDRGLTPNAVHGSFQS